MKGKNRAQRQALMRGVGAMNSRPYGVNDPACFALGL